MIKHGNTPQHDIEKLKKSIFFEEFFMPYVMNMMKEYSNLFDSKYFMQLLKKLMIHPKHTKGRVLKI
jgi:hypothetical protein